MNDNPHQQVLNHSNTFSQRSITQPDSLIDVMTIFKIIFYLIFVFKIIQLSFLRRKKMSLKERIYRKFLFAHQELLRHFTDEDKSMMQTTLSNTIKNASVQFDPKNSKIRKARKHVNFKTNLNKYHDPKNWEEEQQMRYQRIKREQQNNISSSTFEQKKMSDQFIERQDLLGLNESQDQLLPLQSKLSPPSISQQLRQEEITSDLIQINSQ